MQILQMTLVEKKYNQSLDRMSGSARLARTLSLFDAAWEMLSLQILRESPTLSEREKRKRIAERLYASDKSTLALLKLVRE